MTCTSQPAIDRAQLLASLDDEADPQLVAHLKQCAECRQEVEAFSQLHQQLLIRLFRLRCPDSLRLGEYHVGLLPDAEAQSIQQHLQICSHCAAEVAQLETFLQTFLFPDPAPGIPEGVGRKVRSVLAHVANGGSMALEGELQPAFARLRGEGAGPCVLEAGDVQIILELHDDPDQGGQTIFGLVIGEYEGPAKLYVWRDDTFLSTVPIDPLGNFVVPGLVPGVYQFILCAQSTEIYIQNFRL